MLPSCWPSLRFGGIVQYTRHTRTEGGTVLTHLLNARTRNTPFLPGMAQPCFVSVQTIAAFAFLYRTIRYALHQLRQQEQEQQQVSVETKVEFDEALETTALNDHRSDEILAWRCVVRRVLSRAANGLHVVTGRPQGGLSPHHPIVHGREGKQGGADCSTLSFSQQTSLFRAFYFGGHMCSCGT